MDEDFLKQRAVTVRVMAEKADPFIKQRLLDLADRYERRSRPPVTLPSIPAEQAK